VRAFLSSVVLFCSLSDIVFSDHSLMVYVSGIYGHYQAAYIKQGGAGILLM
jgi:hypothetical protein